MSIYLMPNESPIITRSGIWEYVYDTDLKTSLYYHKDCDSMTELSSGKCLICGKTLTTY